MDENDRLLCARLRVLGEEGTCAGGIGTLAEKAVHRTLKYYYEPDSSRHEVELLGSVADIFDGRQIVEIQSAGFGYLVPKLRRFLPQYPVVVVYPLVVRKRLAWLDGNTGELSGRVREVKGKVLADAAKELIHIAEFLDREELSVHIICLECDEYRLLDGYGADKKKRATRLNALPRRIVERIVLHRAEDYLCLLPEGLGEEFSASEFTARCGSRSRYAYYTLRLLCSLGLLSRRKEGRGYIYRKISKDTNY